MNYHYEIVPKDEHLPIRFFYSNDHASTYVSPHWHDYVEILYLLTGDLRVYINGREFLMQPDNLVVIHPHHIHSTRNTNLTTTAYVLQISLDFLQRQYTEYEKISFNTILCADNDPHEKLPEIKKILHQFYLLSSDTDSCCSIKRFSLLFDIIYHFARFFSSPTPIYASTISASTLSRLIHITEYISQNFRQELSLETLATHVGLSPAYLSRFFKKYIGINFIEYITTLRLESAYTLVTTTQTPICQISDECGFANYPMFVKKFRQAYGNTPLNVRKSNAETGQSSA